MRSYWVKLVSAWSVCAGLWLLQGAATLLCEEPARTFKPTDEVRASHILVGTQEEANSIRKEVQDAGGDRKAFSAAARKYSKDVATKLLGGDLGYFNQQSGMDKAFAAESFRLNPGQVSEPVKSSFGWHLIFVTDRREREVAKKAAPPTPEKESPPSTTPPTTPTEPVTPAQPPTPAPEVKPVTPAAPATPPVPLPEPKRSTVTEPSLRVSLITVKANRSQLQQFNHLPEQSLEVNLIFTNEGAKDLQFFARDLLPLGLRLSAADDTGPALTGDFASIQEPANFLMTLKPYEITGMEVSLNDYFKNLQPKRYRAGWDINTFFTNLEMRFPKVKELPDYPTVSSALKKRQAVSTEVIVRDTSARARRNRELPLSVFEFLKPEKKYYAQLRLSGETEPITIRLYVQEQYRAAQHFANLALEGFYDGLDFFDSEEGDFFLGGCPLRTGTGAPNGDLPLLRNDAKLEHKRGTVTFVSRSIRQKGPVRGGQVGSIFAILLKPHTEWNEEHVPFGEVTSGLAILEKPRRSTLFRSITIVTEDQLRAETGTPPGQDISQAVGNPEALIKTSKGELKVELFEDVARNTVANFIELTTSGFYNKTADGAGKQKIINLMKDDKGAPLLVQTGSPTNDFDGGPGYGIRSETTNKKHVRGALVMSAQVDAQTGTYVPDTNGSQFFILLKDIAAWDYESALTVFGQVTAGLDVLDKLAEGDTVESIEITKKKSHPYTAVKLR